MYQAVTALLPGHMRIVRGVAWPRPLPRQAPSARPRTPTSGAAVAAPSTPTATLQRHHRGHRV